MALPLPVIDLRYLPTSEQEAATRQQAIADSQLPFDLSADLLLRLKLFQLAPTISYC